MFVVEKRRIPFIHVRFRSSFQSSSLAFLSSRGSSSSIRAYILFSASHTAVSRHVRVSLISGQIRVLAHVSRYSPGLRQHTTTKTLRYLFSFLDSFPPSFPRVEATRRSDYLARLTQSKDCRKIGRAHV